MASVRIISGRNSFVMVPFFLGVALVTSAFSQNFDFTVPRFATSSSPVPENTLQTVNKAFHASFVGGDWFYQGAETSGSGVSAYIQIPQKLNMRPEMQERYLQQAICPKKDNRELWSKFQNINLSVHIYTMNKEQSVSAECVNPWQQRV